MIPPGMRLPGEKPASSRKPKPAKKKTRSCRCEPSPTAKKAASAKKTAKAAARKVPRAARVTATSGLGHLEKKAISGKAHKPAAAKASRAHAGIGGAKAHSPATAPPKHGQAKTHCQCNKTSTPRPRRTTPRR